MTCDGAVSGVVRHGAEQACVGELKDLAAGLLEVLVCQMPRLVSKPPAGSWVGSAESWRWHAVSMKEKLVSVASSRHLNTFGLFGFGFGDRVVRGISSRIVGSIQQR